MSSSATMSAPDTERDKTPRIRGRRRAMIVASVLLALTGGVAAGSGTAFAQTPPGHCNAICNQSPPGGTGVSQAAWNAAVQAADFWANHYIDHTTVVRTSLRNSYYVLDQHAGAGWPGQAGGGQWYAYWDERSHNNQFVYYGGRYNDYNGLVSTIEQARGVPASRAFSTQGRNTAPYVEYDMDSYNQPNPAGGRDSWRLVRNPNSGNVYVTFDHYQSFDYLGRF
ncbi:hypothetical protein ABZX85_31130 [Streptomyces sp. NPDC004539]|uniref:hypothetical protein n=1 Tax=Streptomyces sp. NPDC004539 TaxID=3154280 RepID=UPI0033A4FF54